MEAGNIRKLTSRVLGAPYGVMAALACLSTNQQKLFPRLLSFLFILLLAGGLCYFPIAHPLPFRDAGEEDSARRNQLMARSIHVILVLALTQLSLRHTFSGFVLRMQSLIEEEEAEEGEAGNTGAAAGDSTIIHVLPAPPTTSPPTSQQHKLGHHRRKLSVAPSPVVAAAVASVRAQMQQQQGLPLSQLKPAPSSSTAGGVKLKIRPRAPGAAALSVLPPPAAAILTTPPQYLRSAVWANSGAGSPLLRAALTHSSASLEGASGALALPSPLSLPSTTTAQASSPPFHRQASESGPDTCGHDAGAAAAAAAESEGERGHSTQYPPRGVLLKRSELSGIVRKWMLVQALMAMALPAAHFALSWPGVVEGWAALCYIAGVAVLSYIVFGAWTVWFISLDVLDAAARKLYVAFRRPHTMTKNSVDKVDFPSYLDWFMHIRRELRRTSEDMQYFVLLGIGGCLVLAGLLFIWGLEDTSAVWEGIVFLAFALLLLASAAAVTSRFQSVLPGLVSSLSVTPVLDPQVHRALAAMLQAGGNFSFSPASYGADGSVEQGQGSLGPDQHIEQHMQIIAAQQQLTAAAQEYSSIITFLLQTSAASDAFTFYRIVLSPSLVVRLVTLGFSAVALLLRNPR